MEVSVGRLLAKHVLIGGSLREDGKNGVPVLMKWTGKEEVQGPSAEEACCAGDPHRECKQYRSKVSSPKACCTVCTFTSSRSGRYQILERSQFYNAQQTSALFYCYIFQGCISFLQQAVWSCRVYLLYFHRQHYESAGSIPFHRQQY
jgi:hypothetical protein